MSELFKRLWELSYPQSPRIMRFLADKWSKFKSLTDATSQVAQLFDISWEEAERHIEAAQAVYGGIQTAKVG